MQEKAFIFFLPVQRSFNNSSKWDSHNLAMPFGGESQIVLTLYKTR